jgi:hypothetical protein
MGWMEGVEGVEGVEGMDGSAWWVKAAPSVDLGWYGAFLQNAEVGVVEYPERCSGQV